MSIQGNQQRLASTDIGQRRDEQRRAPGYALRERTMRGIVIGTGSVIGYEVAIFKPNGDPSSVTWDNVLPVSPDAEFEADDRVMLVWRAYQETPQILSGGGGSNSGAEFLFTVAIFGG
jgi:hypothetical protein